jgi:hypothetical protein
MRHLLQSTTRTAGAYLLLKKVKHSYYKPWRRLGGGRRYSSYSFSTLALDGSERSASRPGRALPPGKGSPVPIGQETGCASKPVRTKRLEEQSFHSAGDRTPIAPSCRPLTLFTLFLLLVLGTTQSLTRWEMHACA